MCGADLSQINPPPEQPVQKPASPFSGEQPPKPDGMKKKYIIGSILVILVIAAVIIFASILSGNTPVQTNTVPVQTTGIPQVSNDKTRGVVSTATYQITTNLPESAKPVATPVPVVSRTITDGFWCRDTTINIGKAPTEVRECYQFFMDGTYKWGYTPGWPMGKSLSCSGSPDAKCGYSLNPNGKIEVQGGYSYTVSGDALIDPHDPPYFIRSATGIP
jgi:hypothetical protein